jgi:hypothetical protein
MKDERNYLHDVAAHDSLKVGMSDTDANVPRLLTVEVTLSTGLALLGTTQGTYHDTVILVVRESPSVYHLFSLQYHKQGYLRA